MLNWTSAGCLLLSSTLLSQAYLASSIFARTNSNPVSSCSFGAILFTKKMTWKRRHTRHIIRTFEVILVLIIIHLITQPHVYLYIEKRGEDFPSHFQCAHDPSIRYSFDNLTMINRRNRLQIQRIWESQLPRVNGYYEIGKIKKSLIGKTIERGGEPERIILVSTWRSGSSYVGTILRSRPGTHYFFEPLHNSYDEFVVRTDAEVEKALSILHNLFYCRDQDGRHITKIDRDDSFFSRSPQLLARAKLDWIQWDPTFVTLMCRRSPVLAMKTVRLPLLHASRLLEYDKLHVKMIYLVRDPQATALSRLEPRWCRELACCADLRQLCFDLVQDFHVAKELEQKYPQRFMVLQYEDLLTRSRTANQLAHFLNMSKKNFLATVSRKSRPRLSTHDARKFHTAQKDCAEAMKLWSYKLLLKNSTATN